MGWTYTNKPKGMSVTDFFYEQGVTRWGPNVPATYKVLDSALVNLKTWYAAIERIDKVTGERRVWAAVIMVDFVPPKRRDSMMGNDFGYKDMDESMGPYQSDCPERILDLLTETDSEYANEWRARCRANIAARKSIPKLTEGVVMKFNEPVGFGDYGKDDYFKVLRTKGSAIICSAFTLGITVRLNRNFIKGRMASSGVTFGGA